MLKHAHFAKKDILSSLAMLYIHRGIILCYFKIPSKSWALDVQYYTQKMFWLVHFSITFSQIRRIIKNENCNGIYRKKNVFYLIFKSNFNGSNDLIYLHGGLITLDCARQFLFIYMYYLWWPMILKIAHAIFNSTNYSKSVRWVLDAGGCGITNTFINF